MDSKRNQSLIIPIIIIGVCLFAFGIPFVFSIQVDDSRNDIVLVPRVTPTPTPLDRILTQQAFANLFQITRVPQLLTVPTVSESFVIAIPVTGPTLGTTPTTTAPSPTPTPTRTLIPFWAALTRISGGGGLFTNPTSTSSFTPTPIPSNTPVPPTNTAIPTSTQTATPLPTNTAIPVASITSTPLPTSTPEPTETNTPMPPTETGVPPPTATEAPPTDPPTEPPVTP